MVIFSTMPNDWILVVLLATCQKVGNMVVGGCGEQNLILSQYMWSETLKLSFFTYKMRK